jgi:transmembrane sensor
MNTEEIKKLAERISSCTATEEEILAYNRICNEIETSAKASNDTLIEDQIELEASIKTAIHNKISKVKIYKINWFRWTAAAAVFILLAGFGYLLLQTNPPGPQPSITKQTPRFKNDVAPGQQGAVLTLSNGQTVVLDSLSNGAVATQGSADVIKKDGQIVYNVNSSATEVVYNTVTTPYARQFHLTLADGTQVWLNAGSSITYPTAFVGKQRSVKITGEVYFEVAHNREMPFRVEKGEVLVEVLGTHFNMNTYDDENALKVTLLEGSVRVVSTHGNSMITPGEQAQVTKANIKVNNSVNLDEVMAWKNGNFHFAGSDINQLMRQVSRWYDVEVIYNKKLDDLFYAEIPIDTKLSDVLKALELTGKVHFAIDGRRVTVMP